MQESRSFENYPFLYVIVSNLLSLSIYIIGAFVIYQIGLIWLIVYLLFILFLEERLKARGALSKLKRPILGINPGAAYGSAKRWLPDRFAEVAYWFIKDTGGSVVVFGGKDDKDTAHEIVKLAVIHGAGPSVVDMAGCTTLRELIGEISECDVFLSNDSGPMHVAYAVGTPLVALFGSTDPALTGPVGGGSVVIHHPSPAAPVLSVSARKTI
jgi:heptosyltransferase-2